MQNEKEIIRKIKQGDSVAFEKVYIEHHKKIHRYIHHFLNDTEESANILQDVFISVWEMHEKLDEELPIQYLLYRITKNKVLNHLRKTVNERYYISYCKANLTESDSSTENFVNFNELDAIIRKSIIELPERRREIFLCSMDEGLSYKEISVKLNISENTVDTQIRNALNYLRKKISPDFR
jgi:RNA polymerase sigma-70 factor, ECF subfamily